MMLTGIQLEQGKEFKYLGCVLIERGLDVTDVDNMGVKGGVAVSKLRMLMNKRNKCKVCKGNV